jgi:hypothetical protein
MDEPVSIEFEFIKEWKVLIIRFPFLLKILRKIIEEI